MKLLQLHPTLNVLKKKRGNICANSKGNGCHSVSINYIFVDSN